MLKDFLWGGFVLTGLVSLGIFVVGPIILEIIKVIAPLMSPDSWAITLLLIGLFLYGGLMGLMLGDK